MKKNKIIKTIIVIVFLAVVALLSYIGYNFGQRLFSEAGTQEFPGTDIGVVIEENMSRSEVAEVLYDKGLIRDEGIFAYQCIIFESEFYTGEYVLNTSDSPEDIIEKLKVEPEE